MSMHDLMKSPNLTPNTDKRLAPAHISYRKYDKLSYKEIEHKLRKKGVPEQLIAKTRAAVEAFRAERTKEKARKRMADKMWGELIMPLQHERRIVRSMRRYKTTTPTPERDEFVQAYELALAKTYERIVEARKLQAGLPVQEHWTDFVPLKIKQALRQAAGNIPERQRAKFKEPFARTSPSQLNDKRRDRLLRRCYTELKNAEQEFTIDPENERLQTKIRKIKQAMAILRSMPHTKAVPNSWQAVIDLHDAEKKD